MCDEALWQSTPELSVTMAPYLNHSQKYQFLEAQNEMLIDTKKKLSAHNQVYFIRWLCLAIFDKRFSICWYIRRLEKTPSPRECIVIILCIYTLCIMCISYYAFTIFLSSKTGFKVSVEYQTFAPRVILMAKEPWLSLTVVLQLKLTFTIGRFHFYK